MTTVSVRLCTWLFMTQTTHQFKLCHLRKERNVTHDCAPTELRLKCCFSSSQVFFSSSTCSEQTSDHSFPFLPAVIHSGMMVLNWNLSFHSLKKCGVIFTIAMLISLPNHKLFPENHKQSQVSQVWLTLFSHIFYTNTISIRKVQFLTSFVSKLHFKVKLSAIPACLLRDFTASALLLSLFSPRQSCNISGITQLCWTYVWIWKGRGKHEISIPQNKKNPSVLFPSAFWKTTMLQGFVLFWSLMVSVEKWFCFCARIFFCNSLDHGPLFSLPWAIMGD